MARATTVRFTDEMFARLDQASSRTGMPVNSIVIAACLEWMERHTPPPGSAGPGPTAMPAAPVAQAPRWATIRRAVKLATQKQGQAFYPFERFTVTAQAMLTASQAEADKTGHSYIGTEHLLLAAFADPASQAARALEWLGIEEEQVRQKLDEKVKRGHHESVPRIVPTSRVKRVIETAFKLCTAAGDPRVSTGHILHALATEREGIAAHVLKDLGAPVERIGSALELIRDLEP